MNLIDQIISSVEHWQNLLLTPSNQDQASSISNIEQAAQALSQRIAQLALSHLLESKGTGYDRSNRSCPCGGKQRFERFSPRTIRTLIGEVTYKRAYYRCRRCCRGSFPLDEQISQSQREISPGVERAVALLAAQLSFPEAERLLKELTSVSLSARQIETISESIGAEAELLLKQEQEEASKEELPDLSGPNQPPARTFIVEMDGVQVGLKDGSWQEVKCGIIYELSQRVEISEGRWELLKRERCAVRANVKAFRARLWALCLRAGLRECDRVIVIGDGAAWIDQTAEFLFARAERIVDYYHVSERIWAVANMRWGESSRQARRWAKGKLHELKEGKVLEVIGAIKRLKMKAGEGQEVREGAIGYLSKRVEQMKYGKYRKEGMPIGSGAIESSCKQLVTARCKQAGMRWSEAGLDAIVALRCFVMNERLDEICPKATMHIEWAEAA